MSYNTNVRIVVKRSYGDYKGANMLTKEQIEDCGTVYAEMLKMAEDG